MIIKARARLFIYVTRKDSAAMGQHEYVKCLSDRSRGIFRACKRTVVDSTVVCFLLDGTYSFPLTARDPYIAVPFIVFEQYVVFRLVLFYKIAFENERFKLTADIEIIDILDHFAHLARVVVLRAEIL